MNALSSAGTTVAAIMAIMTTVVTWRVLRDHSTLDNPVIPVCVGLFSFIGLRYLPGGLAHTILIGYVALAIAILFMLLFMAFQKARRSSLFGHLFQKGETHIRRKQDPSKDSTRSRTETRHRFRRQPSDEDASIP